MLQTLEEVLKEYDVTEQMLLTLDVPETVRFYEKNGYHKEQGLTYITKKYILFKIIYFFKEYTLTGEVYSFIIRI